MTNGGLAGGDQPLHGPNLIGKATLNVLQPRGRREITPVEEKRSHVCHEHFGLGEEVARVRQLRSGEYIQRLDPGDGMRPRSYAMLLNICVAQYFDPLALAATTCSG
jgi:hypothetical protein